MIVFTITKKSVRRLCFNLAGSTSGAEIAETAMVLPLLFVVLLAIFWFGQAYRYYGTITHAAREGARAAVAPICATCGTNSTQTQVNNAVTAVNNALTAANLNPSLTLAPSPTPNLCACGTASPPCGTPVTCVPSTSTTSNVCVQPNVQLSYTVPTSGAPGAGTCGTSVSFTYKYPFHFTLPCWPQPCTSLDLSKITLPAQAEMREETQ
jgi:Flp pilus assembly protein TadG